jgi:hypothetical protein
VLMFEGNCSTFGSKPAHFVGHLPPALRKVSACVAIPPIGISSPLGGGMSCWGRAETLGTDNHTYPSKNVKDEETLGKRTDVRGNCSNRTPVLGDLEQEPGICLIKMMR